MFELKGATFAVNGKTLLQPTHLTFEDLAVGQVVRIRGVLTPSHIILARLIVIETVLFEPVELAGVIEGIDREHHVFALRTPSFSVPVKA